MMISKFLKKFTSKPDTSTSVKVVVKARRAGKVKTVALENLPISRPRSTAELLRAYKAGHFAEMSPKQAGL